MNRLALGTVQFGLKYGVANSKGQVPLDEAKAILEYASNNGVDTLDTAISYGESEKRLGEIGVENWRVVSKLPEIPKNITDVAQWVGESVHGSLERLKIPKLDGLLLHRPEELLSSKGKELYSALIAVKDKGKTGKIGVSIYSPDELNSLWPKFKFDIVQAPFNIIDRRLASSGWLARLHNSGVEVHTRSAFLQGLLLMHPKELPEAFSRWQPLWEKWHEWTDLIAMTPLQACLGFAISYSEISRVVVGVDSLGQLKEILSNVKAAKVAPPDALESSDEDLINPSRWSRM